MAPRLTVIDLESKNTGTSTSTSTNTPALLFSRDEAESISNNSNNASSGNSNRTYSNRSFAIAGAIAALAMGSFFIFCFFQSWKRKRRDARAARGRIELGRGAQGERDVGVDLRRLERRPRATVRPSNMQRGIGIPVISTLAMPEPVATRAGRANTLADNFDIEEVRDDWKMQGFNIPPRLELYESYGLTNPPGSMALTEVKGFGTARLHRTLKRARSDEAIFVNEFEDRKPRQVTMVTDFDLSHDLSREAIVSEDIFIIGDDEDYEDEVRRDSMSPVARCAVVT